jgi:phosphodiesterase/alkaline phosphatase D-like protein
MGRIVSACLIVIVSTGIAAGAAQEHGPFMADGIKIGEVRQDSAIVWTRLTRYRERTIHGLAWTPKDEAVPQGRTLDAMEGSVPGATGEVRVIYWPRTSEKDRRTTSWQAVDLGRDFTLQFRLDGLAAGMQYQLEIQGRPAGATEPSCTLSGGFKTAPMPDVPARVALLLDAQARSRHRCSRIRLRPKLRSARGRIQRIHEDLHAPLPEDLWRIPRDRRGTRGWQTIDHLQTLQYHRNRQP